MAPLNTPVDGSFEHSNSYISIEFLRRGFQYTPWKMVPLNTSEGINEHTKRGFNSRHTAARASHRTAKIGSKTTGSHPTLLIFTV